MLGNAFEVIVGLLLLIWGADRFVHGAAAAARNLGVPPLLIGLTIVALATSAPEILVSLVASLRGEPDLAVGNAIGSNIANIGLVLGIVATLRPIELKSATLRREMPALLAVTLLTVSLFLDSYLSRVDGLVLLTGLVIVMIWLSRLGVRSSATDPLQAEFDAEIPKHMNMRVAVMWLLVGIGAHRRGAPAQGCRKSTRRNYFGFAVDLDRRVEQTSEAINAEQLAVGAHEVIAGHH